MRVMAIGAHPDDLEILVGARSRVTWPRAT